MIRQSINANFFLFQQKKSGNVYRSFLSYWLNQSSLRIFIISTADLLTGVPGPKIAATPAL